MNALILAAGYGTRLYPLVTDTPKPLLDVGGRPLVDHVLDRLQGCEEVEGVYLVTNEKFRDVFRAWAEQREKSGQGKVRVLSDGTHSPEERLGSVGDIRFAHQVIGDNDYLVIGGDNIFDFSLQPFLAFAREQAPHASIGVVDIGTKEKATQFGVVSLGKGGKVESFVEKPAEPASSLIAMCCYYFPADVLKTLNEYMLATGQSDKAGDYIRWLAYEKGVYGFQFQGKWYDIGSMESYEEAQKAFQT